LPERSHTNVSLLLVTVSHYADRARQNRSASTRHLRYSSKWSTWKDEHVPRYLGLYSLKHPSAPLEEYRRCRVDALRFAERDPHSGIQSPAVARRLYDSFPASHFPLLRVKGSNCTTTRFAQGRKSVASNRLAMLRCATQQIRNQECKLPRVAGKRAPKENAFDPPRAKRFTRNRASCDLSALRHIIRAR